MEYNNQIHDNGNPSGQRNRIKDFFSEIGRSLRGAEFAESAKDIVGYLGEISGLQMAIVIMRINKGNFGYEICFSSIFSKDGIPFKHNNFRIIDVASNDMPEHLAEEVNRNGGSIAINFSKEDLAEFYVEKDAEIIKSYSFNDVLEYYRDANLRKIIITDRVFYTRIDCYDRNNRYTKSLFFGLLKELPDEVATQIYPFKSLAYSSDVI